MRLPQAVRDRIDAELRHRRVIHAAVLLRDEGRLDPTPGLYEAQDVVMERFRWLDREGLVEPEPTVEIPELVAAAQAIPQPVVAIEATWDGDTQGWFVRLTAIVERPGRYHDRFDDVQLAVISRGSDIRLFTGAVPPWPEATEATAKGEAVAAALGVPFHFTQPDKPDDQLPRWWDLRDNTTS